MVPLAVLLKLENLKVKELGTLAKRIKHAKKMLNKCDRVNNKF
jgi:hypothetical protein